MENPKSSWKAFYRQSYSADWADFSRQLAEQPYHVRYQETCLASLRGIHHGRVLEVGVGRGDLIARFVPPDNERFGCDISEGNLQACAQRFRESPSPVFLASADAEQLPFRDDMFDAVYCLSVLWYVPNWRQAVGELFRTVKPGGWVLFDMLNAWHITSLSNHYWRKLCRLFGRELGRTSLATPYRLEPAVREWSDDFHLCGNYLWLPAGLPILKEWGNLCRFFPSLAYAMEEHSLRGFAHKLLVIARKR